MKTLVTMWPWWSFALLFAHIFMCGVVIVQGRGRGLLKDLTALRAYLIYCVAAGIIAFAAACLTPIDKPFYGWIVAGLDAGFNLVLLLLCSQVVDHLIYRDDVQRVKKLWLFTFPALLGLAVIWNNLYPHLGVQKSVAFDSVCAAVSGCVLFGAYITPDEDWRDGYKGVTLALAFQIVTMALINLVESLAHFPAVDIAAPLASLVTLTIFFFTVRGNKTSIPALDGTAISTFAP